MKKKMNAKAKDSRDEVLGKVIQQNGEYKLVMLFQQCPS